MGSLKSTAGRYTFPSMDIMEVEMRVATWGNSLAVRLPAAVVEELGLKAGDEVELTPGAARSFEVYKKPSREELIERLKSFRGSLPADYKFDRDEANAR
jgi:antitoxin MazE